MGIPKYVKQGEMMDYLSPLMLAGTLMASGLSPLNALKKSSLLIRNVPKTGMERNEFFEHVCTHLSPGIRYRFITLEVVKRFLLSDKSHTPLFIFIGGMAGKTVMGSYISQHLGITQAIAIDNEKFRIVNQENSQEFLWRATYESPEGYIKTVDALIPWMLKMIERNLFDYKRFRKWCYMWEGIYLSPRAIKKLYERHKSTSYFLSVFILPEFQEIKNRYLLRWQKELGVVNLQKRRNIIDTYLKNLMVIRGHIEHDIDPIASFVISSPFLEERLKIFYALLHQTLKDIAEHELPGWVTEVERDPKKIRQFDTYLLDGSES